eukprot:10206241-Alexandrium_andersonii.AAC.1
MPNAGRPLGQSLGSATRLCLAHLVLEGAAAALPQLTVFSASGIAGMRLRCRPPPVVLPISW